jgi:hypothetical protein
MFEFFEKLLSLKDLIWLMPAVFLVHDFEEIFITHKWLTENRGLLEPFINKYKFIKIAVRSLDLTRGQMAVAVAFEFVIIIAAAIAAASNISGGPALYFFTAVNGALLLHVFSHIAQSAALKKYTPGVITAVVFVLPYSLYVFHRFFWGGVIGLPAVILSLAAGAVIILPVIFTGHFIGRKLIRK